MTEVINSYDKASIDFADNTAQTMFDKVELLSNGWVRALTPDGLTKIFPPHRVSKVVVHG